jgi:L-ascorbate metabolism protein UlaG (beta-lactamase superfamily)
MIHPALPLSLLIVLLVLPGGAGSDPATLSDHFDGERFLNPGRPRPELSFLDFWRWRLNGDHTPWPDEVPNGPSDRPPERVADDALRVSFVGHATVLIQVAGLNLLTDPIWSDRASPFSWIGPERVQDPGIAFEDLPPIDAVLVSHNHYDHLDEATLAKLWAVHRPRIIAPLGNEGIIRSRDSSIKVDSVDWSETIRLSAEVSVTAEQSLHWSQRGLFDGDEALWAAYVITTPSGQIFFSGDTGYGDGELFRAARRKYGEFRLALLPIGAYEPRWIMGYSHMTPEESVFAHRDLGARHSLAIHHGAFRVSDEGRDDPAQALETARTQRGVAEEAFRVLEAGESWFVPPLPSDAHARAEGSTAPLP